MKTIEELAINAVKARDEARRVRDERSGIECPREGMDRPDGTIVMGPCWKGWANLVQESPDSPNFLGDIEAIDDADMCEGCKQRFRLHAGVVAAARRAGAAQAALTRAVRKKLGIVREKPVPPPLAPVVSSRPDNWDEPW